MGEPLRYLQPRSRLFHFITKNMETGDLIEIKSGGMMMLLMGDDHDWVWGGTNGQGFKGMPG